jgi:NAD(P)-dependent dehydrogenase (short-subunit alcohol dehydrogenase family)
MPFHKFSLIGKTALITGAAGLLGIEHAEALLESGATAILTDRSAESLDSAAQILAERHDRVRVVTAVMDVTDPKAITAVAAKVSNLGLSVDILVNNAAIDPKVSGDEGVIETSRVEHFHLDNWNQQIAVGLTGAFLCSQVFGSQMAKEGRGGAILNIASDLSILAPDQRLYRKEGLPDESQPVKPVTYSVIKSGLIGLTRYLATYWADHGVRCNALSPGGIFNDQPEDFVRRITQLIPLGRMARKDEYRAAVQFLCSDASIYMNGQNVVMDGGRSVW